MIEKLIKQNALWKYDGGDFHVQTSESGLHSDLYLNTDYVISNPQLVSQIVKQVFIVELSNRGIKPDWIITYPPFGITLGFELAKQIGAQFGYVDIKSGVCDFDLQPGQTVIVVGDDIYSGGSIIKSIESVEKLGVTVLNPILSIGNFSGTKSLAGVEVVSAISERGNLCKPEDCPMCKNGSQSLLPRPNWKKFI